MTLTDEQFREEFKPLQIPAAFSVDDSQEDKILYALAVLEEATATEVADKLEELQPGSKNEQLLETTSEYLEQQFRKGLLNGGEKDGETVYNLSKVTRANEGGVDPDLLLPGVD